MLIQAGLLWNKKKKKKNKKKKKKRFAIKRASKFKTLSFRKVQNKKKSHNALFLAPCFSWYICDIANSISSCIRRFADETSW